MAGLGKLLVILVTAMLPLLASSAIIAALESTDEIAATVAQTQTATTLAMTGELRVWQPNATVQTTIYLDGVAKGQWGFWSDMPQGNYSLTFSDVAGWQQPTDVRVLVYAIGSTVPEQDHMRPAPWNIPVYAGKFTEVRVEFIQLAHLNPSQQIALTHKAEEAGATSSEIGVLVTLLNRAVQLSEEAVRLTSPSDAQRRADLLRQADEILATLETKSTQLQSIASQRTFTITILTYMSGAIAAFVGTVAYACGVSFWHKYRVRRTFEMRVSPK